jgi:hypothetical protein
MPLRVSAHPPNTRVLVIDERSSTKQIYEIVIVEWSPSGDSVRLRFRDRNNFEEWTDDRRDGPRLEILPPLP